MPDAGEADAGARAPRISLRALDDGDAREVERLGRALVGDLGWFELDCRGARWGTNVLERAYEASKAFFNLSDATKSTYVHTQYANESGGYVPMFEEYAYRAETAARLESFDVAREIESAEAREDVRVERGREKSVGLGPVDWPVEVPEMRTALRDFRLACDETAKILLRSFALALKMDDEDVFLREFGDYAHCFMRVMRYPAEEASTSTSTVCADDSKRRATKRHRRDGKVEIVGIAEHTDFEFFTLLHQTCEGLELRARKDGAWHLAAAYGEKHEAIFTVILADAFEILTNGVVRATPHRVRPSSVKDRYSLVRFNGLNHDAKIAPLPCFGEPKFAPRTQGDHVGEQVSRAADNLGQMLQNGTFPKSTLTEPPKRFAQMIVLDVVNRRVLLGKHLRGEFENRYTGFIASVNHEEELTPIDVARTTALLGAGLNPLACDALTGSDLVEVGRFVFRGWIDNAIAIEHEFVAAFRRESDLRVLFASTELTSDVAVTYHWFDLDQIPYDEMPEDDAVWYPCCLARWVEEGAAEGIKPRESTQLHIGHFEFDRDTGEMTDSEIRKVTYVQPTFVAVRRLLDRKN